MTYRVEGIKIYIDDTLCGTITTSDLTDGQWYRLKCNGIMGITG